MPFSMPTPQDNQNDKETFRFLRELWNRLRFSAFTWNPPNVGATSTVDTTLTTADAAELAGLRVGMAIHVTPPSTITAGLNVASAWVATDDTLTIRLYNSTAGGINLGSTTWNYMGVIL